MNHDALPEPGTDPPPGRYDGSRLVFRGPLRALDGRHVAFVGGGAMRGGPVARPFPALVGAELGVPAVNLGLRHASVEAFLLDPVVGRACRDARLCVLEVMGAANLSNRLYTVHPRRNDRFLRASGALRAIYPEVDFTEVCFTRHLLTRLHEADAGRFEIVQEELRLAWEARMRAFLERVGRHVVLLWPEARWEAVVPLGAEPLFVTRAMVESLRPLVRQVVPVRDPGTDAAAHREVAAALLDPVRAGLDEEGLRASA
jgi:hypothetical protein